MRIAIAADHAALALKQRLVEILKARGIEVDDLGTSSEASVDYPDYATKVAALVSAGQVQAGVLACGTGIGMSIVANKFKNVRAALVGDEGAAKMAKAHNDANILCLSGRNLTPALAKKLLEIWLDTPFEGGRHHRRLEKISEIEKTNLR